ncbi:MAG: N-formylglutamate amidohydrolase [Cyclobacteriaceae bacterium]|jgi:predicted N-formylglutamate amidohydrolase|nr:N-formylglutamate amidohydrolase [Cyclobacteriaceae bacterium]
MYQSVVFSCEHAGNNVPNEYAHLFQDEPEVLQTHRGWDPGAWTLAQFFALSLNAPLLGCESTRLLIEANRSEDSPELFSVFSKRLLPEQKEKLHKEIYHPYRNQLQGIIEASKKPVLHLSIHSFTPVWNGEERTVDIGILFDPNNKPETDYSHQFKDELEKYLPDLKIRFNEPYRGTDDGITTWLRKFYSESVYTGIELEVNQKFASDLSKIQNQILNAIQATLH